MSGARSLAVYDGMVRLGAVVVTGDGCAATYSARDARGRKLGTFSTIKAAVAAIPSKRSSSSVPRKRREPGDG